MNISRLKNLILLMLFAANLVLAGVLGVRAYEARSAERRALVESLAALAALGAKADAELFEAEPSPLYRTEVERDRGAETAFAERFIGAAETTRASSGSFTLGGGLGSATMSGAGRFDFALTSPLNCASAADFAERAGLSPEEYSIESESALAQLVGGSKVFGQDIELLVEDGGLVGASGGLLLGDMYVIDATPSKSLTAALLQLAADLNDAGTPAGAILSVELGYTATLSAPGYSLLEPTWRVETEFAGVWFVDAFDLRSYR